MITIQVSVQPEQESNPSLTCFILGTVSLLAESHDSAYLFSGGGDGNVFGYLSLAHEEIIKSMEGKKAKLPTPRVLVTHG